MGNSHPVTQLKGKLGIYLLHHGVKHASKPGKVIIVFDCSTNYGGTSLNNKLLSGSDLTNQLAGVLIRFRTEEVAFMVTLRQCIIKCKFLKNREVF